MWWQPNLATDSSVFGGKHLPSITQQVQILKIGMEQLTGANGDLNRMLLHLANLQTLGQKNCLNSRVLKMYREIHGIVDSSSLSSCIAYLSVVVCMSVFWSTFHYSFLAKMRSNCALLLAVWPLSRLCGACSFVPSVRFEALNTGNQIWSASFCTVAIVDDFLWRSLQKYDLLFADKFRLSMSSRGW